MSGATHTARQVEIKIVGENSIEGFRTSEVNVKPGDRILWVNTVDQECIVSFPCPFGHEHSGCGFHVPAGKSVAGEEIAGEKGEYQFTIKFANPTKRKHRGNPRIIIQ